MDVKPFAGPWEHDDKVIAWWGGSLKGVRVSFPQNTHVRGPVCIVPSQYGEDVAFASAKLIAAAPDLLEALLDVMSWIPGGTFWHTDAPNEAMEKARAAIRKAIT